MPNSHSSPPGGVASLVDLVRFRAQASPDTLAYVYLKDGSSDAISLTYAELERKAREIAAALTRHTVPGDRALINHQPSLDYIISFFGCLFAGVTAVPVYPPRFNTKMERLDAIVDDVEPRVALTSKAVREALGPAIESHAGLHRLKWIETDSLQIDPLDRPAAGIGADTLAFLQYTSGSTSSPKGVMLSHGNLMHNLAAIGHAFETGPGQSAVSWLPPYHDMGLIGGILSPLYAGMPSILMSPYSFLMRPARWLQAITRYKGTFSGGPNFAFELCVKRIPDRQLEELDLSSWDLAFCGAEPIRAETLDAFARKFERCGFRAKSLYPCYGLAEATLMVTGGKRAAGATRLSLSSEKLETTATVVPSPAGTRGSRTLIGCGGPSLGNRVEVVDPVTRVPREDGHVGEIWVSGPSVAQGYWRKTTETETTYQATIAGDDSGDFYLRTGDLGFKRNGEIFVTGRIKDLVILRGRNYYPQDIERTVGHAHPALNVGACAVVSVDELGQEQLVIIQELSRGARDVNMDEVADAIRREVFEHHGVSPYAISLLKPNSIPLTSSGKIQRQLSRQLFLGGTLEEVRRFTQVSESP
jgi:acyl-CoA synthetase (AMP-forming)/AMP-acid ligase II